MSNQQNKQASISIQDKNKTREILRRLIDDDHGAWCELVDSHTGLLLGLAHSTFERHGRKVSKHDTEDAIAAVWRNLLANDRRLLRICLERGEILPLLHTLVRNRCIDMMRKCDTEPKVSFVGQIPPDLPIPAEVNQQEDHNDKEISVALDSLQAKEKTCVSLFYLQGRSYREIAELTGIPINSIGPTMSRAIDKLKNFLSPK